MTPDDLDGVCAVAAVAFPDHFEDRECFADRLVLHPEGCQVLTDGRQVSGYLIAYPSRRGSIPALNSRLNALPDASDVLYVHDLALRPQARGTGHARAAIRALVEQARGDGWQALALVAVNDAESFWARHGFEVDPSPELEATLSRYGQGARYMLRRL